MSSWTLGHRPGLDGIRGLAILLVLAGHLNLIGFDSGGWVGVTMFFTLSGFLITALLLEEHALAGRIDFIAFYLRRACRLLPALAMMLAVVVPFRLLIGATEHIKWQTAGVAFYFGNWYRVWSLDPMGPFAHTWSLAIEEQFYLIWPGVLVALLALTRGRRDRIIAVLVAGAAASILWRLALWHDVSNLDRIYVGTDTRADALLLGAAFAVAFTSGRVWSPKGLVAIGAIAAMYPFAAFSDGTHLQDQTLIGLTVGSVGSALVVAYAATHPARLLALPPLPFFGRISYGLYLYQYPILIVGYDLSSTVKLLGIPAQWWAAVAAIGVSIASYYLVEKRIMDWNRRWTRRRRAARNPAPALAVAAQSTGRGVAVDNATR